MEEVKSFLIEFLAIVALVFFIAALQKIFTKLAVKPSAFSQRVLKHKRGGEYVNYYFKRKFGE